MRETINKEKELGTQTTLDRTMGQGFKNVRKPCPTKFEPTKQWVFKTFRQVMIRVSWNSCGMGSRHKAESIRDLIRMEKPSILLIQENKLEAEEAIKICKHQWRLSEGQAVNSRGCLKRPLNSLEQTNMALRLCISDQELVIDYSGTKANRYENKCLQCVCYGFI